MKTLYKILKNEEQDEIVPSKIRFFAEDTNGKTIESGEDHVMWTIGVDDDHTMTIYMSKDDWKAYSSNMESGFYDTNYKDTLSTETLEENQREIERWDNDTFGSRTGHAPIVAVRVLEEAFELCQCYPEITPEIIDKVQSQVYNKTVGQKHQEVAGILVSLLNYCNHADINAQESLKNEITRIWKNQDKIREKNKLKIRDEDLK